LNNGAASSFIAES